MLTKICDYCGKEFERNHFKPNKTGKYFCSNECQKKYRKKYSCWTSKGVKSGKGENIWGIHCWVRNRKPKPELCGICGEKPPKDLANLKNHEYTRNLDDYTWLCQSCHQKWDRDHGVARGRKKGEPCNHTEEGKRRIAQATGKRMKKYWKDHPNFKPRKVYA